LNVGKLTAVAIFVMGFAVQMASLIFMGIVFFSESILGKGVMYVEPNRLLAFVELSVVGYGMAFAVYMLKAFFESNGPEDKAKALSVKNGAIGANEQEPDGYARNDGMYR